MALNRYTVRELTPAEIAAGEHRGWVGGMWEEIGRLQFDFLSGQGLAPQHRLLDLGCGALRGGIHFIRYLDPGHYFGLDINRSLLEAARLEITRARLDDRAPALLYDAHFDAARFGVRFDFALAVSVFTHIPGADVARALSSVAAVLAPAGVFFATYFEAPMRQHATPIRHEPGGIVTRTDSDPYHYAYAELESLGAAAGLRADRIGDWGHPRAQRMARFCLQ